MKLNILFSAIFTCTLLACAPINSSVRLDLLGDPAPVSGATKTIVITPETKYVNVTGGDIVKFVVGDKSFAWNFDGMEEPAPFDLNLAAPAGILDHKVMVYVAPNPMYMGGGGRRGHGMEGREHGDGRRGGGGGYR